MSAIVTTPYFAGCSLAFSLQSIKSFFKLFPERSICTCACNVAQAGAKSRYASALDLLKIYCRADFLLLAAKDVICKGNLQFQWSHLDYSISVSHDGHLCRSIHFSHWEKRTRSPPAPFDESCRIWGADIDKQCQAVLLKLLQGKSGTSLCWYQNGGLFRLSSIF